MPDNKGYNITSSGTNSQVSLSSVFACILLISDLFKLTRATITVLETMALQQPTRTLTTTPTRKFALLLDLLVHMMYWTANCTSDWQP